MVPDLQGTDKLKKDLRTVPEVRDFQARPIEEATFAISHSLLAWCSSLRPRRSRRRTTWRWMGMKEIWCVLDKDRWFHLGFTSLDFGCGDHHVDHRWMTSTCTATRDASQGRRRWDAIAFPAGNMLGLHLTSSEGYFGLRVINHGAIRKCRKAIKGV
jgi:hypothetical protein